MKMIDRLWPKVAGGPIQIRVGYQMEVGGSVTWGPYFDFDPSTQTFAEPDPPVSGRAV